MKRIFLLLIVFVLSVPLSATYNTATIVERSLNVETGQILLTVEYTGNAGEPVIRGRLIADGNITVNMLRQSAIDELSRLNNLRSLAPKLTIGTSIDVTAIPPPTLNAQDTFFLNLQKWHNIKRAIDAGILTGLETEVAAFKKTVQSQYQASYINAF